MENVLVLNTYPVSPLRDKAAEILPEKGNLSLCLTCGACISACPASGILDMDPRKFLRMAALGLDDELRQSPWLWVCTLCERCLNACPMRIQIPRLVYLYRQSVPREKRPKGIVGSCDHALRTEGNSAMGASSEDFRFVVGDILEEVRETQEGQEDLQAPVDKQGAMYFLNQNSREPVTEPDEMVPLWKILNLVGADWTYGSLGWAGENYCMFEADDERWEQIVRNKAKAVDDLGCKYWLNTE